MRLGVRTLLVVQLAAAPAFGGGILISDGDAVLTRYAPFDTTPAADFTGVSATGSQDHLLEFGWWYRLAGDTEETEFGDPSTVDAETDSSVISWSSLGGGTFKATEYVAVADDGSSGSPGDGGAVRLILTVENLTEAPITVQIFHMLDLDLNGPSGDSASIYAWEPLRIIRVVDAGGIVAQYVASNTASFAVLPAGAGDVGAVLTDASVTNFGNTGLPFSAGDFTGGYQFPVDVAPFDQTSVLLYFGVNWTYLLCGESAGVFCDGFELGTPAVWSGIVP